MEQPMQILTSHKSKEWYTPLKYIELARCVLGRIGLDPASCSFAQGWINADKYLTEEENGLLVPWTAKTVWLNPPYGKTDGKSNQAVWSAKMVREYQSGRMESGILLVNSTHGYKWYEQLYLSYTCCLASERIRFVNEDGTVGGQAKRGQTFVYFGKDESKFIKYFSSIGRILRP